jgi:hypothetical protein
MLLVKAARLVGRLPLSERLPGEADRATMPDSTQLPIPNQLVDMSTRILKQTRHLLDRQEARLGRGGPCTRVAHIRAQRHEPEPRTGVLQPNRAAADLTPYWAAYSRTGRRPRTLQQCRRLIERSSMESAPFLGLRFPSPPRVPFQRKYFSWAGLGLVASPGPFGRAWSRLAAGYVGDAIRREPTSRPGLDARRGPRCVRQGQAEPAPAVCLGEVYRLGAPRPGGAAPVARRATRPLLMVFH